MIKYASIKNLWKTDPATKYTTMIEGAWSNPVFEYLQDQIWIATEKIDGMNMRIMRAGPGELVRYGGRTDNASMKMHWLEKLQSYGFDKGFEIFGNAENVCLYGEGFGEGVAKGGLYGSMDFILFDIKVGDTWLERHNVEDVADKLGIRVVPIVATGTLSELMAYVSRRPLSKVAEEDLVMEGVVARPEVELFDRRGDRVITKIKAEYFPEHGIVTQNFQSKHNIAKEEANDEQG